MIVKVYLAHVIDIFVKRFATAMMMRFYDINSLVLRFTITRLTCFALIGRALLNWVICDDAAVRLSRCGVHSALSLNWVMSRYKRALAVPSVMAWSNSTDSQEACLAGNPDVTVDSVNSGCRNTRSLMSCDRVESTPQLLVVLELQMIATMNTIN